MNKVLKYCAGVARGIRGNFILVVKGRLLSRGDI